MNYWNIYALPILKDNYVWMIINANHEALIVDPGEATPVLQYLYLNQIQLRGVLLTHKHWDHTNGAKEITDKYSIPVFGPKNDHVAATTEAVFGGDKVALKNFPQLEVIDIPGHTLGHIAFFGEGILFCGDTLFSAGCGKIFEGTPEQMHASLKKLSALPGVTKMYCGHEYTQNNLRFAKTVDPYNREIDKRMTEVDQLRQQGQPSLPSNIELENAINPFLRCHEKDVVASAQDYVGKTLQTEIEVLAALRDWKNNFS